MPRDKQFLGKTRDESTGLTQIGARYYDELVGSFISVDPLLDLADPQQWNGYAYAHNNPVSFTVPTGLLPQGYSSATFDSMDRAMADRAKHKQAPATVDLPVADASVVAVPLAATGGASWLTEITWGAVGRLLGFGNRR
ncbi:RHS repeat-associated core domain-containing protein [Agromyces silvae]|uniref:RHS repeat-associated core domain-containing protein n=1 Tax=Agromyces silvae TaxID=3388266 RepID=UPI00280BD4A1|nr:RHS repeat-associated core domain-containing protein [Agromyces protaetiae]